MTQTLLPDANSATTAWVQLAGDGDGDWFDELDEGVDANDGDTTAWRIGGPTDQPIAVTLQDGDDPGVGTGHVLRAAWRKNNTGGIVISGKLELLEGVTVRATATDTDVAENTYQIFELTLSEAEADAITDYANLIARVTANTESGTGSRSLIVTALELQIPDAAGGEVVTGAVSVAAVSDVVVDGLVLVLGDAVVAAVGTFASDGLVQVFGQTTIAGTGLVVVEGDVAAALVEGSVLISASSSIVFADGLLIRHGEVQIGAQGEAAADGLVLVLGGALVAADGDVAVDGLAQVFGAVTLAGTGIVVIDGSVPSSSVETSASLSHALVTGTALSAALITTTALDHNLITEAFPDGD